MDAKPQRPPRTLRVYDENSIPAAGPQKTIHQRNKSSPQLSTLLQAGGLKVAAKRSAFGDVSNIANALRPSKDDSAIGGKADYGNTEKLVSTQQDKKTTSFLRPVQRPLSVSGLKSLLGSAANHTGPPTVKQPVVDIQSLLPSTNQSANPRKIVTKKATTIFKDSVSTEGGENVSEKRELLATTAPIVPVHRELLVRQQQAINEDIPDLRHDLTRKQSQHISKVKPHDDVPAASLPPMSSEGSSPLKTDGIYLDEKGQVQFYDYSEPSKSVELVQPAPKHAIPHPEGPKELEKFGIEHVSNQQAVQPQPVPTRKSMLAPVSEPEEYWDDEAEEAYEEEGYVTARSFKSRGDNTTGGATTILFPKENQKIKKEIAAAKDLIEGSKTAAELEDEAWDTTMVAEYGEEIFQYMKDLEVKMLPNAHYMDNQAEIQWSMRAVLMDWIVQVHHRFNLLPETLFLCVNYIDRFLSCKVVSLGKLQLVGATAIFIAAKYEEIDCPSVQEIVYMVDGGYTVDEILKAERFMLSMLQFELGWPGPMSFLRRISKADDYDLETRTLAKYFLEITIMDERFVGSPPSFVAAGAHCLARMMLKKGTWSAAHVYYSNYTYTQLFSLVLLMVECCEDARKHHCAVYDKYTDKRFKRASSFAESEMIRGFQILDVASNAALSPYGLYDNRHIWGLK